MGENVYVWCLIKVTLCTAKLMVGIAVLKAKTMHNTTTTQCAIRKNLGMYCVAVVKGE